MNLVVVGTSYKYSSLVLREKLSFSRARGREALCLLRKKNTLKAAIVLSTCNRIEVYADTNNAALGIEDIKEFLCAYQGVEKKGLLPYLYEYSDSQALKHLFCVASGMDSLILGESQIAYQVRQALLESKKAGCSDRFLNEAFNRALSFARKIHRQANISAGKVSVGSIAVDFIKEKFGSLADKNVLVLGVGKVTELVVKYLKKEKPKVVFVSNRTFEKAKKLALRIGAEAVHFDKFEDYLKRADAIITATKSPKTIINKDVIERAKKKKLVVLDLAVPRDVDPKVKQIRGVELFHLEDLNMVIEANFKKKTVLATLIRSLADKQAKESWEELIESELETATLL